MKVLRGNSYENAKFLNKTEKPIIWYRLAIAKRVNWTVIILQAWVANGGAKEIDICINT